MFGLGAGHVGGPRGLFSDEAKAPRGPTGLVGGGMHVESLWYGFSRTHTDLLEGKIRAKCAVLFHRHLGITLGRSHVFSMNSVVELLDIIN